ncbi:hypothetical protein GW17_00025271 [Ensete ventricosum]|nr:hypothetical protein GW17_00025271 [Ensete ventricosum]
MASKPMFPSISPTPRGAGRYQQTLEKKQRSRRSLRNSPAHARGRRYGVRAGRDDDAPHRPFIPGFPPCGARRRNLPRPDDVSGLLHSRLQQPRQGPPRLCLPLQPATRGSHLTIRFKPTDIPASATHQHTIACATVHGSPRSTGATPSRIKMRARQRVDSRKDLDSVIILYTEIGCGRRDSEGK